MTDQKEHWDRVYGQVADQFLGWYEAEPKLGLDLIQEFSSEKSTKLFIAGGGTTNLVDALIEKNKHEITFADISQTAIDKTRERLGEKGTQVKWLQADLSHQMSPTFEHSFDLWYDRAVFHFVTEEDALQAYVKNIKHSLKPGGQLIIGVFSDKTSKFCSGLPVHNYSAESLRSVFEKDFDCLKQFEDTYTMPSGDTRLYLWSVFQKR